MRFAFLLLAAPIAAVASLAACSSSTGGACQTYAPSSGADLKTPTSFKNDVLPIFHDSCAFSSCHADRNDATRVYLGSRGVPTDPNEVYGAIVNKQSQEISSMSYVTPSDPGNSFLMHKMNGDQCTLDAKCADGNCGTSMPQSSNTLPESTRLVVYRWIAQGAPNN